MPKLADVVFSGESGQEYDFKVFPFDTDLKEFAGVYMVTLRHQVSAGTRLGHKVLYVGEADDLSQVLKEHDKQDCFKENEANCICIHHEEDGQERMKKAQDLLKGQNPTCNA